MVIIDELKINSSAKTLTIKAHTFIGISVPSQEVSKIEELYVIKGSDVTTLNPVAALDKAKYKNTNINSTIVDLTLRENINITTDLSSDLYFVVFKCTESADEDCLYSIHVVYDTCLIYNKMLSQMRELTKDCSSNSNFTNNFLQYLALKFAILSKHYLEAISYFEKFFLSTTTEEGYITCGCNGRNSI